jgi:hydroxyacylglutathione hydrolase
MKVELVQCLLDNYSYLLMDSAGTDACIVDPSESGPILKRIDSLGLKPLAVLCTHHHEDHVGGLAGILNRFPGLAVFGHPAGRTHVAAQTRAVDHGEVIQVGTMALKALHVPGHTLDAITWLVEGIAFTGDTMLVAGCGKLLEGTAAMMYTSLNEVIGGLDGSTQIFCGHEYTAANLRFSFHMDPNNLAVQNKLEEVLVTRFGGKPTVPSSLWEERETNPFLRCGEPGILETARRESGLHSLDPLSVFTWLRERKDRFRVSEMGR